MMFQAPTQDILVALRAVGAFDVANEARISEEDAEAILNEAGRFAAEEIAPLNQVGDTVGATFANGTVTTAPGWTRAYRKWCDAGWSTLNGPLAHGGQDLQMVMSVACTELWNAASVSFAVNPLLTTGAIEAISAHASPELKAQYLPRLIEGKWTGTMNLTEPQSGSDLSELRCRAERATDGTYRISGTKIYITYGEHDCSDNIIHLVLARLKDAPDGTRGISLFLVPKILPDGTRNDVRCQSIEHKLGLNGSPTCTMVYGDSGGATGWLIGVENRGLQCMFTMMNNARLLVGAQGVGVAERATQMAYDYAHLRKQGRAVGQRQGQVAIAEHPDVRGMLLEMRSKTLAARLLCMATAAAIDGARFASGEDDRTRHDHRASLLTPLAKAYATDIAVEVASLGIQVHGGMGYIEAAGAAQLLRDARILPIYEGTNGIQAVDLVTRKLALDNGNALKALLDECETITAMAGNVDEMRGAAVLTSGYVSQIRAAAIAFQQMEADRSLACATYFARALASVVGSAFLCKIAATATDSVSQDDLISTASFFVAACASGDVARCMAYIQMKAA
jgi:acyl-CoA dehydrogenase